MDKQLIKFALLLLFSACGHAQIMSGILNPIAGTSPATVSHVADCGNFLASGTTFNCTINSVTAGDLVEGCATTNTGGAPTISISDGTSTFAAGTLVTGGAQLFGQCFWLLSANGGNRTYTVTFNLTVFQSVFWVQEIHATSGTWHIDTGNQAAGSSTSLNTGNITTAHTTGEAMLFATSLANTAATASNPLIGSHVPTELGSSPQNTFQHAYYLLNTGVIAGAGTLTYSPSTDWVGAMVACYVL